MKNEYLEKCANGENEVYCGTIDGYRLSQQIGCDELILRETPWGRNTDIEMAQFKEDCVKAGIKTFLLQNTSCNWMESLHSFAAQGIVLKSLATYDERIGNSILTTRQCVRMEILDN